MCIEMNCCKDIWYQYIKNIKKCQDKFELKIDYTFIFLCINRTIVMKSYWWFISKNKINFLNKCFPKFFCLNKFCVYLRNFNREIVYFELKKKIVIKEFTKVISKSYINTFEWWLSLFKKKSYYMCEFRAIKHIHVFELLNLIQN